MPHTQYLTAMIFSKERDRMLMIQNQDCLVVPQVETDPSKTYEEQLSTMIKTQSGIITGSRFQYISGFRGDGLNRHVICANAAQEQPDLINRTTAIWADFGQVFHALDQEEDFLLRGEMNKVMRCRIDEPEDFVDQAPTRSAALGFLSIPTP